MRFINDILLSAPSIIIGLFIYEMIVVNMGHFSAWAGAMALAIIVVPVVVAHDRGHAEAGAELAARGRGGAGGAEVEDDHHGHLPRRAQRHDHRRAAGGRAHQRRDGTLLFTALNNQFWSTNMNAPMANLPVVIFQFAMSPYANWQSLAWGGALLITAAILLLNIVARSLAALGTTGK